MKGGNGCFSNQEGKNTFIRFSSSRPTGADRVLAGRAVTLDARPAGLAVARPGLVTGAMETARIAPALIAEFTLVPIQAVALAGLLVVDVAQHVTSSPRAWQG